MLEVARVLVLIAFLAHPHGCSGLSPSGDALSLSCILRTRERRTTTPPHPPCYVTTADASLDAKGCTKVGELPIPFLAVFWRRCASESSRVFARALFAFSSLYSPLPVLL